MNFKHLLLAGCVFIAPSMYADIALQTELVLEGTQLINETITVSETDFTSHKVQNLELKLRASETEAGAVEIAVELWGVNSDGQAVRVCNPTITAEWSQTGLLALNETEVENPEDAKIVLRITPQR